MRTMQLCVVSALAVGAFIQTDNLKVFVLEGGDLFEGVDKVNSRR